MDDTSGTPLATRPPQASELLLREKFWESLTNQSTLMDALGRHLLGIEMAIPGIYAAVLKLNQGDKATAGGFWFYATFALWLTAVILTFVSLIPREWKVNPNLLKPDPAGKTAEMDLETFFTQSARYKRNFIVAGGICSVLGSFCAAMTIF